MAQYEHLPGYKIPGLNHRLSLITVNDWRPKNA
jgi:hypothetical protein